MRSSDIQREIDRITESMKIMKCMRCAEKAQWLRHTQFGGDHPFCDLHALLEEGFGIDDSYEYWSEVKEMGKKLFMVETVSIFRMRYVVEARESDHAAEEVAMQLGNHEFKEFSQQHIDENIISVRELSATNFLDEFDADNNYLKNWSIDKKMEFINVIEYKDKV
jgi:hypothetical protein